jgi:type II secretory pathway predicted ATPase ExeA
MNIERSIYRHFGKMKPEGVLELSTTRKINQAIEDAVYDAHWVAIHGPIMAGKSTTVDNALELINQKTGEAVRYVNLYWPERKGINISEILNQIIYTLGPEFIGTRSPKRGKEIRMYQVLDILIEAKSRGHHVVLQIDEAHELHGMTLKALKRLWEYKYKGKSGLLTIVLIGQEKLDQKVQADREIRKRCYRTEMKYSTEEKAAIARFHGAGLVTNEMAAEIAERLEQPGDVVYAIREALLRCMKLDKDSPTISDFKFPKERTSTKKQRAKAKVDHDQIKALEQKFGAKKEVVNG